MDNELSARFIVTTLVDAGYIAYYAGGWVRDMLLGISCSDIDIATNAPPERIIALFPKTVPVGMAFGSIIVLIDGQSFEVTSFRSEGSYLDGRHPENIILSTPEEDALRRDFTINAMFYNPLNDEIIDFVGGKEDLAKQIIRAVGNPIERFEEDRLRMMRAVRFSARFNFPIEDKTAQAIAIKASSLFPAVSMERIWQEFNKMAEQPNFDCAIIELQRYGLLQQIFPQLLQTPIAEIEKRVSNFDRFPAHTPTIAFLMELFPKHSLREKLAICQRLKTPNKSLQFVEFLSSLGEVLQTSPPDLVAWVHLYAHPDGDLCLHIKAAGLSEAERISFFETHKTRIQKLLPHIERIRHQRPLVSAHHLKEAGVAPSKKMGLLLQEAEKIAILENLNDAQEVLARLKKSPLWA